MDSTHQEMFDEVLNFFEETFCYSGVRSHSCSQACESKTPTPQLRHLTELQAEPYSSMCLRPWELLHYLEAQNADQSGDTPVSPKA